MTQFREPLSFSRRAAHRSFDLAVDIEDRSMARLTRVKKLFEITRLESRGAATSM
jgi:hypothetical protein